MEHRVDGPARVEPAGASPFAEPFSIGGVRVPNRVVLAPMAGLTNSAYRRHMKTHGVGAVTTEMVSAYGLIYGNERTRRYLEFHESERPLGMQLFADDPAAIARAAEIALSQPSRPDFIDINMGCPVRKVVRSGAGCALMKVPERALAVTTAVVTVATQAGVPVTVKLRSGIKVGERTAVELARRLEQAGVAGFGVHPRAAEQFYRGRADHTITAEVAAAVQVPVIASGDIVSVASALHAMSGGTAEACDPGDGGVVAATDAPLAGLRQGDPGSVAREGDTPGVAAVMVARGTAGDPWLVERLLAGEESEAPPLAVVVDDLRVLLGMVAIDLGPVWAARWIRKLLGWYLKPAGVPTADIEVLRRIPDAGALDEALVRLLAPA